MDALPSGSYLAASHATNDLLPADTAETFATKRIPGTGDFVGRSSTQFLHFFDGLDLVPPGLEVVSRWRPECQDTPPPEHVSVYGGLALKP